MFRKLFRGYRCNDHLANKIARCKGELAAVAHMLDHYSGMSFDPNSVPGCWQHAQKVQAIHDLHIEHAGWMKKLNELQNRMVANDIR